jgi:hydroxymethylpyrimidine/phosphomethylpyrimidine kinase
LRNLRNIRIALTIAGSDSGGGAGIQADLKTFAALGVHGTSAITCITAQNPKRVLGIEPCSPRIVRQQLAAIFTELRPVAVKTGMLYSAAVIRTVVDFLRQHRSVPLVVDPVMVSTSGARLLKKSAVLLLTIELLPLASLVTPNVAEAELLVRRKLKSVEDLRAAAKELQQRFGSAVLVKGGHLRGSNEAADIYFDGKEELLLRAPFIRGVRTHGTGCTYSAAIAAYLARGLSLCRAVQKAKEYVTQAIAGSRRAGRHDVLNTALNPRSSGAAASCGPSAREDR